MMTSDRRQEQGETEGRRDLRKGLILLAVGTWFLLNTLGIWERIAEVGWNRAQVGNVVLGYHSSWPLLMILIGVAMTIAPDSCGRRSPGPLLIGWGALCWVAMTGLWGFHWSSIWPLVLVLVGLSIVWNSLQTQKNRRRPVKGGNSNEGAKEITKLGAEESTDER